MDIEQARALYQQVASRATAALDRLPADIAQPLRDQLAESNLVASQWQTVAAYAGATQRLRAALENALAKAQERDQASGT